MNEQIAITTSGKWIGESDCLVRQYEITREITPETAVAIVGTTPLAFSEIWHLKGIVRLGVGYDNLPLENIRTAGIKTAYTPNAPSQAVAEHAFALMMAALRFRSRETPGRMLGEISLGLIGRGRIGRRFAAMLSPFVREILVYDPVKDTTFDEIHGCERSSLDELLEYADVVSLHVPKTPETIGMIRSDTLPRMKNDAILINTSRGGIVAEPALLKHLEDCPTFTAALDVFAVEPYDGPLLKRKNCICTPHVAAMTLPARNAMENQAIRAARAILQGDRPEWPIPEREPWQ